MSRDVSGWEILQTKPSKKENGGLRPPPPSLVSFLKGLVWRIFQPDTSRDTIFDSLQVVFLGWETRGWEQFSSFSEELRQLENVSLLHWHALRTDWFAKLF